MDQAAVWAARWGEIGIILLVLIGVVVFIWVRLSAHEKECRERNRTITEAFARGGERMNGLDEKLTRGTTKIDTLTGESREHTAGIARLDERSKTQGDQLVRVEGLLNKLIGFHTRQFTDEGDQPPKG